MDAPRKSNFFIWRLKNSITQQRCVHLHFKY
nr:MAG TPA: hypothetical protein [Caudoviricetes sp.]